MAEYLELHEILNRLARIRPVFDALMNARAVVGRPNARQWRFIAACFEKLLLPDKNTDFDNTGKIEAAQLKFEVEDRLRRFYLRPGMATDYVFTLAHHKQLTAYGFVQAADYPAVAGYCLLVREVTDDKNGAGCTGNELKQYLERVVAECIDAEFRAYQRLPEICEDELLRFFLKEGPAFSEIYNLLIRHRKKEWVISNPFNPSTKRLLSIKVGRIQSQETVVRTSEYWYIRWYNQAEGRYVYPYRETNRQLYILRCVDNTWKVYQNIRPSPRTSIPLRWSRKSHNK